MEEALRSIAPAKGGSEDDPLRRLQSLQKNLEDGYSVSSSELIQTQSEPGFLLNDLV